MILGASRRRLVTRARHSRGLSTIRSAGPEPRQDLRGDLLQLRPLVARVADRVHEQVGAARPPKALDLLGALLGGADDSVPPGERLEVLSVALAERAHPNPLGALVISADRDERQVGGGEAGE